jgi:1-acyl-sn-glycerol-3-phosphate acyltransferase
VICLLDQLVYPSASKGRSPGIPVSLKRHITWCSRQPYGKLGEYQKGGISIAKKTGCDISPVYHNAGRAWPKGSFIKYPNTITVVIGSPISVKGKSTTALTKKFVGRGQFVV